MSACCWRADERIIAHRGDCLKGHVTGSLYGPFIILLQEQGTDQPDDGVVIGEDADDLSAPLDLAVETLYRVGSRYKIFGSYALLQFRELRRMLRASGTEAPGPRRCGQLVPLKRIFVPSWA